MHLNDIDTSHVAILVIDMQNDYCHPEGSMAKAGNDISLIRTMIPRLKSFLAEVRQLRLPVIHVHNEFGNWVNSPAWLKRVPGLDLTKHVQPGSWGAQFCEITPEPGEYVVTKHRYSAFVDTDLPLVLRSQEIKTIVLTGEATNVCIETTARHACTLDYFVVILEDCVAATTIEEHQSSLITLGKYFSAVTTSQQFLKTWKEAHKVS